MIRKLFISTFVLFFTVVVLHAQLMYDLSNKTVFTDGFPQYFSFRGEMSNPNHKDYNAWTSALVNNTAIIKKFTVEEFPALKAPNDVANWANTYAEANPEILMLLHYNGRCRSVEEKPEVFEKYFPGHWVLNEGTTLTSSIDEESTVINCATVNNTLFSLTEYRDPDYGHQAPYLLLVPIDHNGNKLWYESEYVRLIATNISAKQLTVKRAQLYSNAKRFDRGTYIAALPANLIAQRPLFYYNLSSVCPKDSKGKTAADVYVDELVSYFNRDNGLLKNFNGIGFDVNYFDVSNKPTFDVNNDGVADGGIIDGYNVWREGDWNMLSNLRNRLGPDYVISADGHMTLNQQAVGILNGIESEGLVQHNDAWRGISRTLNTHLFWRKYNDVDPYFGYVVMKFNTDYDDVPENIHRLCRFVIGSASCLEAHLTQNSAIDYAQIQPEWIQENGALGFPVGPLIRVCQNSPEVLSWTDIDLKNNLSSNDGTFVFTDDGVRFNSKLGSDGVSTTWKLNNINLPKGDLTFFMEAKAVEPLQEIPESDVVPRRFDVQISNLPDYGETTKYQQMYEDIYGYFCVKDFTDMSFYYRRPNVSAGNQNMTFTVQGGGDVLIKNLRVYNAPDVFAREFDKGIVIVNPSLGSISINPYDLFPNSGVDNASITVPAVDAVFIKKTEIPNQVHTQVEFENYNNVYKVSDGTHKFQFPSSNPKLMNVWNLNGCKIQSKMIEDYACELSLTGDDIFIIQFIEL